MGCAISDILRNSCQAGCSIPRAVSRSRQLLSTYFQVWPYPGSPQWSNMHYICLDEGLDDKKKQLVRDCSCSDDSAGFAHLSCIVEYAKQKSKQANDTKKLLTFSQPWKECPNCKQLFKHQLLLDLSFVIFYLRRQPVVMLKTLEKFV